MDRTSLEDLQKIRVYISIPRRLQKCGPAKLAEFRLLLGDDEILAAKVIGQAVVLLAQLEIRAGPESGWPVGFINPTFRTFNSSRNNFHILCLAALEW
jgi:hypothetical protein